MIGICWRTEWRQDHVIVIEAPGTFAYLRALVPYGVALGNSLLQVCLATILKIMAPTTLIQFL